MQVLIRFQDAETERKALGKLIPRSSGRSWANGETLVPSHALPFLSSEGIAFTVVWPSSQERIDGGFPSRPV